MGAGIDPAEKAQIAPEMKRYFNFSKGQVAKLKERLDLTSDEFGIDKQQLISIFKCSAKEAEMIFKVFDLDNNGKIDSYEFICGMALISQASLEEKAEMIFNLYDFDGNKFITRDELVIMLSSSLSALNYMAGKKAPTIDEIEKKANEVMSSSDVNNDKKISLPEFKSYITKNKDILGALWSFGLVSKDDLRPDFGGSLKEDDLPDNDSDLEKETDNEKFERDEQFEFKKEGTDIDEEDKDGENKMSEFKTETIKKGDEFMATKPWIGVVKNSVPTGYKQEKGVINAPDACLDLEYIHGYRCEDTRNNLRYTQQGKVVYHTAAVGVVLDTANTSQKHFFEHTDDIISLAIHPNMTYVATGEVGRFPLICVWDTTTMECLARISGLLKKGITHLCFSQDGNYLAASSADDSHCIAIYDWEECTTTAKNFASKSKKANALVATGQTTRSNILSLLFNPSGDQLVAPAVKEINFITFAGGALKVKKGLEYGEGKRESLLCATYIGTSLVTGGFSGKLYIWKGPAHLSSRPQALQAHTGCVNAIWGKPNGFITGGNDGLVIVWNQNFKQVNTIDLKTNKLIHSVVPKVRSVCDKPEGLILVGLRSGEILEIPQDIAKNKPKVLMRSHFKGELWGLAVHPKKAEYATIGDDMIFAIWDIKTKRQRQFAKLDNSGKVVAYSPDGVFLALGLINGQVLVINTESGYSPVATRKDRNQEISEIKFAPDCSTMAVGAHDSFIFIYDVSNKFKLTRKLKGHHSTILHIDYSENSQYIQSNCSSYEILFFDVNAGTQLKSGASMLKDEKWASWTCVLGWSVQGIWPPYSDGTDINAVDRSPESGVLATADDFGKVKLFKYPCPIEKSPFLIYRGHSSHVTNVRFIASEEGRHLISIGGHDKSIFQWRYSWDGKAKEESEKIDIEPLDMQVDDKSTVDDTMDEEKKAQKKPAEAKKEGEFTSEEIGKESGTEWLAVKPFVGQVKASTPNNYKPTRDSGGVPDQNLTISYVHGYRSFDTRNNVKWTKNGSVLFHTAALGVVQGNLNEQSFFIQHDEDIVSLAIHPQGLIAATGQMAAKGKAKMLEIYVWNIETKEILSCLKGFHRRAIRHLRFSPNGSKLLSVGEDDDHSFALYDWTSNKLIASSKVDRDAVTTCEFKNDNEFITCGLKHVKFWSVNGLNVSCQRGLMGASTFEPQVSAAFAFMNKICVTGTTRGNLILWSGRNSGKRVPAHAGMIWALLAKNNMLYSGGQDGILCSWTQAMEKAVIIDLNMEKYMNPGIRAIDLNNGNIFLVGTKGAEILQVHKDQGKIIMRGHFAGELWGLAVSPNAVKYATCGGDSTVRVWGVDKGVGTQLAIKSFKSEDGRAIDWSSNGNFVVWATVDGKIYSMNPNENLELLSSLQSTFGKGQWIEDIKICPNNTMLAFGAHRGVSPVQIMKISTHGKDLAPLYTLNAGLTSALTHLDWDVSSNFLVVNSQAYELEFLSIESKSNISASSSKDIEWHTWTSVLGFPVQGVYPPYSDGTDVNSTCRCNSRKTLVSADDFGKVKLFKYPCVEKHAAFKEYSGHSSHVTKVKFTFDDKYVISTGGNDKTIILWTTDFGTGAAGAGAAAKGTEEQQQLAEDTEEIRDEIKMYDETDMSEIDKKIAAKKEEKKIGDFTEDKLLVGTEFMASKPWMGAIKEPKGFIKAHPNLMQAPKIEMKLEYVHGYRSRDCKNNLKFLKDGSIAYHAAALGIVLDKQNNTQRHFNLHTDDVLAIAFHPDGIRVATGEQGPKPCIYIWDSTTCSMIAKFKGQLEKGIRSLAYSPKGDYLAAIDMNTYHMLAVYDANNAILLAMAKTDTNLVLQVCFKSDYEIVTAGPKHYMFWTISGKIFNSKRGIFGKRNNILGCLAADKDMILTGNVVGEIYQWNGNTIQTSIQPHDKPVDCITIAELLVLTGGRDGNIFIFNKQLKEYMRIMRNNPIIKSLGMNPISPGIRALALDTMGKKLLVGTFGSEIYELDIDSSSKEVKSIEAYMKGHYSPCRKTTNEIWGLAVFANISAYATVSDDATLRIWDIAERKQIDYFRFDEENGVPVPLDVTTQEIPDSVKARAIEISEDGKFIIIGFKDGSVRAYDSTVFQKTYEINRRQKEDKRLEDKKIPASAKQIPKLNLIKICKDSEKCISDIKISPNSQLVAIGSHDTMIRLYSLPKMEVANVFKGHTSYITHIDWSIDSQALHSNSGDYELLFWDARSKKRDASGATTYRDEEWFTWNCVLGWPVQGIFRPYSDGTDVNACDRSKGQKDNYKMIVTGDDFSCVRVFRYPCLKKGASYVEGKGHSSHVTNVKFARDDTMIFSIGGNDGCVFQWSINQI